MTKYEFGSEASDESDDTTYVRVVRPDPAPPGPDKPLSELLTPHELARQSEYRRSNLAKIAKQLGRDRRGQPIVNLDDDQDGTTK